MTTLLALNIRTVAAPDGIIEREAESPIKSATGAGNCTQLPLKLSV